MKKTLIVITIATLFTSSFAQANIDKNIKTLKLSCESGNAKSCFSLSEEYLKGKMVKRSSLKAMKTLKKSCELGAVEACEKVSVYEAKQTKYCNERIYGF